MIKNFKFLIFFCFISNIHVTQAIEKPTPPKRPTWMDDFMQQTIKGRPVQNWSKGAQLVCQYEKAVQQYKADLQKWQAEQAKKEAI